MRHAYACFLVTSSTERFTQWKVLSPNLVPILRNDDDAVIFWISARLLLKKILHSYFYNTTACFHQVLILDNSVNTPYWNSVTEVVSFGDSGRVMGDELGVNSRWCIIDVDIVLCTVLKILSSCKAQIKLFCVQPLQLS